MNELRRQSYLTSMGIDSYIPRMLLVQAPTPYLCELPVSNTSTTIQIPQDLVVVSDRSPVKKEIAAQSVQEILKTMSAGIEPAIDEFNNKISQKAVYEKPKAQENYFLEPFILTVWRPREDYLIVDACEKGAALPTHLLLQNILRYFLAENILIGEGDRVQFPLIESIHGANTSEHICNSVQTWFSAEYEKRPSPNVWLMGENTVQYLLSTDSDYVNVLWQDYMLGICNGDPKPQKFTAKILPSLSDFLLKPNLKAKLWQQLRR